MAVADDPLGGAGRQPHLDGLRALAVYLVVGFHAGVGPLRGGFIGVDAFFVLSGFLITGMLLDEWRRDGRVRLRRFYARRFRRLMPAAAVCLVGTLIVMARLSGPNEQGDLIPAARAGSWFVANWHFIGQSRDYFAPDVQSSPFLHWWSLAVEEQFYFVWPLLLVGLMMAARRFARPLLVAGPVIAALAGAATVWTLVAADHDALRAYYATDTRAFGLLGGAALAVLIRSRYWLRLAGPVADGLAVVALGGLVVLGSGIVELASMTRAVFASGATVVLIAALHPTGGGVARRVLGWRPLAYLGTISYATYLWHWPIIIVIRRVATFRAAEVGILAAVTASALAALSAEIIERPVRDAARLDRRPVGVIVAGIVAAVLLGVVVVPATSRIEANPVVAGAGGVAAGPVLDTRTPVPAGLDQAVTWRPDGARQRFACLEQSAAPDPSDCVAARGDGPKVILIGDSTAEVFIDALAALAQQESWTLTLATHVSCIWQQHLGLDVDAIDPSFNPGCTAVQDQVFGPILDASQADIAVVMNLGRADKNGHRGLDAELATHSGADLFEVATRRSVARLLEVVDHVVLVAPIPSVAVNGPKCLAQAASVEQCAAFATIDYTTAALYRRLAAEDPRIETVDFADVVCPANPVCEAVIDGLPTWADATHPNAVWIESRRQQVLAELLTTRAFSGGER